MNDTMIKFGYPTTLLREYEHWVVLLRPQQVTLGSMVMICKEKATTFSQISEAAFSEHRLVIQDIERIMKNAFSYSKINYLMLMMMDKEVHYHVIPRYRLSREVEDMEFMDTGWPGLPDLLNPVKLSEKEFSTLYKRIKQYW